MGPEQKQPTLAFDEDMIMLGMNAGDDQEALMQLSECLLQKEYVKDTFVNGVIERENHYPTGLQTTSVGVAIPHTSPSHVVQESLAIGVLNNPVAFRRMDTGDPMEVSVLFMLAISNPDKQLQMLQQVMGMLREQTVLNKIAQAASAKDVIEAVQPFIPDVSL
ncbi:PTS sugar transporter subunit IIA [Salibacterium aidingense]|uniref:PTS sugar transporter subunit IIA n=1 Tax=Salibacterium aidingense TaxID=384933 RepID=UPI003BCDDFA4